MITFLLLSSSTSLILYTGRRYVETILEFDPSDTKLTEEIKTDSETKFILFYDEEATGNFISSIVPWTEYLAQIKLQHLFQLTPD